ncbi:MAG: FtsX-like permease family protein, partial [Blastocatellia bacterium]
AYGWLMMFGLRTWWVGAVGTTQLRLHVSPQSLLIGLIAGVLTALLCIWLTLRSLRKASPRSLLTGSAISELSASGKQSSRRLVSVSSRLLAIIFALLGVAMLASSKFIGQVGGFFGAGTLLLVAVLFFWSWWLKSDKRATIHGQGILPMLRMGFRNAAIRPSRSVLCIALIASAAFIIVSVDAFRRNDKAASLDKKSGTGGYPLIAESLLPIVHDPNGQQGREELGLTDDNLKEVKLTRFRLRPGDDASCLNLYAPRNPRILGATGAFIKAGRFSFAGSLAQTDEEKANPWLLLIPAIAADLPPPIPVIADANSLTYVLHLKVGDETALNASDGRPVRLKIVGALADSILQGELLMSEQNFVKLFPDQQGYRVFLVEGGDPIKTATALEDKLSDYGFDAISTEEKLASFHQVENTYLSTFQTLGGLGLLLGTLGLGTVLLRNVLERRKELALMRAIGFQSSHLSLMVIAENVLLLGCGLLSGVLCAAVAIAPAFIARGGNLSIVSLSLLLLAVLLTGLAASLLAVLAAVRSPLLAALRTE